MGVFRTIRCDNAGMGSRIRSTPQGGAIIPASVTRTGVLSYSKFNPATGRVEQVREYRSPEEVFSPESLATLDGAPITSEHPEPRGTLVTAGNFRALVRGNLVNGSISRDLAAGVVGAEAAIQDAELLQDVASGVREELSAGYECDFDPTPGVTPEGEVYDRKQVRIRYNHVAVVQAGRAGDSIRLHLDSLDNITEDSQVMETITIDGVVYPLGTPAERQAAIAAHNRSEGMRAAERIRVDSESAKLRADREAVEKSLTESKEALDRATDRKRFDAAVDAGVEARVAIILAAKRVMGGDYDFTGKDDATIMAEVVEVKFPGLDTKGKSPEYLAGVFAAASADTDDAPADGEVLDAPPKVPGSDGGEKTPVPGEDGGMKSPVLDAPGAPAMMNPTRMDSKPGSPLGAVNAAVEAGRRAGSQQPETEAQARQRMVEENRKRGTAPLRRA